jgi:uncharacterized repeat protein (TIGR03803 family)
MSSISLMTAKRPVEARGVALGILAGRSRICLDLRAICPTKYQHGSSDNMRGLIAIGLLWLLSLGRATPLCAQTLNLLHSFSALSGPLSGNGDGANPVGGLAMESNRLYATANRGGRGGTGAIVAMEAGGGGFTNLHSFAPVFGTAATNEEGAFPVATLTASRGVIFGAARAGGRFGTGTIFRMNADGSGFMALHHFTGLAGPLFSNSDGAHPVGILLSGDTLYGTANDGGVFGNGSVFLLSTNGAGFTTLHSFSAAYFHASGYYTNTDGANPLSGLVLSNDTLFGTTVYGGVLGQGSVFAVRTDGLAFSNLHNFTLGPFNSRGVMTNIDGANPSSTLVLSGGTLYGTTQNGGQQGGGTVFALGIDGAHFVNLHSLNLLPDGASPVAGVVMVNTTLYGSASIGGAGGSGTLFGVGIDGNSFTNLHFFSAVASTTNADGANPLAGLLLVGSKLYGATYQGGPSASGTLFSLAVPALAPPLLNISRSGETIMLTWPTDPAGFVLQSASGLHPPRSWTNELTQPLLLDGKNTVTDAISAPLTLYRLSR